MREPQLLTDARFLLARLGADAPPTAAEVHHLRGRLTAMRAHPSCDASTAQRITGALLVLDVLALAGDDARPEVLAG